MASSASWVGRTIRTAMSASRRSRSSGRFDSANSMVTSGWLSWKSVSSSGSTSPPITSLAVIRTTPRSESASPDAVLTSACAADAIAWACGRRARAVSVGLRPPGERVNSGAPPSAASSASMCRPTVGWAMPRSRAAPDRLPLSITARNER